MLTRSTLLQLSSCCKCVIMQLLCYICQLPLHLRLHLVTHVHLDPMALINHDSAAFYWQHHCASHKDKKNKVQARHRTDSSIHCAELHTSFHAHSPCCWAHNPCQLLYLTAQAIILPDLSLTNIASLLSWQTALIDTDVAVSWQGKQFSACLPIGNVNNSLHSMIILKQHQHTSRYTEHKGH